MPRPGYTSIIVEVYDSGPTSGKHGTRHIRPAKASISRNPWTSNVTPSLLTSIESALASAWM